MSAWVLACAATEKKTARPTLSTGTAGRDGLHSNMGWFGHVACVVACSVICMFCVCVCGVLELVETT